MGSSNRTFMELKYLSTEFALFILESSNRTFMELKLNVAIDKAFAELF